MRSCSIMLTTAASFGCIRGVSSGVRLLSTPLWAVARSSRLPICCRNCSVRSAICNAHPGIQHAPDYPHHKHPHTQQGSSHSKFSHTQQGSSHTARVLTHNKVPHTQQGSTHTIRFLTRKKVPHTQQGSSQKQSVLATLQIPQNIRASLPDFAVFCSKGRVPFSQHSCVLNTQGS